MFKFLPKRNRLVEFLSQGVLSAFQIAPYPRVVLSTPPFVTQLTKKVATAIQTKKHISNAPKKACIGGWMHQGCNRCNCSFHYLNFFRGNFKNLEVRSSAQMVLPLIFSHALNFLAISRSMAYNSTLVGLILFERIMTVLFFLPVKVRYIRLPYKSFQQHYRLQYTLPPKRTVTPILSGYPLYPFQSQLFVE